MNRSDLHNLATVRLDEAKLLLAGGHPSGAYYLAGYCIECALKAVIALQTQQHDFPDKQHALESFIHDLEKLLKVARLAGLLQVEVLRSPGLGRNWATVATWSETSRYKTYSTLDAAAMMDAVGDPTHGVLPWIMQYW